MNTELKKLVELLSLVLEEGLDSDLAEGLSEKIDWSQLPELSSVYSNLFHYWHDCDIREKDADYASMQKREMEQLLQHLKDENFSRASEISFLGASQAS